jgi:hypothetical protein
MLETIEKYSKCIFKYILHILEHTEDTEYADINFNSFRKISISSLLGKLLIIQFI